MTKPRRDVKFQHRGSVSNGSSGKLRRPSASISDISENASSEPGSPTRNGSLAKSEVGRGLPLLLQREALLPLFWLTLRSRSL